MSKRKLINKSNSSIVLSFISIITFVYIVLFEFILPANKFLPKPSTLIEAVPALINDYNFITSFIYTISIVYSVFLISYFLIKWFFPIIVNASFQFKNLGIIFNTSKYFIPLFLILLFEMWFGNSIYAEIFFVLIIVNGFLKGEIFQKSYKVKEEYILSAKSLGLNGFFYIYWKSFQPQLFEGILKIHFVVWSAILIYEYVSRANGLGGIFYQAIKFHDLSIIIVMIIILLLTFWIMENLMNLIKLKFFFWENLDE
ncbi:MAG: hypothetical protein KDC67_02845 [Ignavibacteriae bacterium]|nr:hypothetical protein [Ignavibacteriota bacterium]